MLRSNMSRLRIALHLASTLALSLPGCVSVQQPATPQSPPRSAALPPQESAVRNTLVALFAAVERPDLAALDTLYAGDSLTVVEGASISRGWADYRDGHLMPEVKQMTAVQYRPSDIEVHVSGNLAWTTFSYILKADAAGRPVDIVGRGTAILERRGNRWVVRHTQTSGRARRPTDPPAE